MFIVVHVEGGYSLYWGVQWSDPCKNIVNKTSHDFKLPNLVTSSFLCSRHINIILRQKVQNYKSVYMYIYAFLFKFPIVYEGRRVTNPHSGTPTWIIHGNHLFSFYKYNGNNTIPQLSLARFFRSLTFLSCCSSSGNLLESNIFTVINLQYTWR